MRQRGGGSGAGFIIIALAFCLFLLAMCYPRASHGATARSACEQVVRNPKHCAKVIPMGHRAHIGLNENTIRALRSNHRHHVQFETDTWRLRGEDGPATGPSVIFHDTYLKRVVSPASIAAAGLTPMTRIDHVTLHQFRILRTKGGAKLPTLRKWIKKAGRWHTKGIIEVKYQQINPPLTAHWVRKFHAPVSFYATPKCGPNGLLPSPLREQGLRLGIKYHGGCKPTPAQMASRGFSFVTGFGATRAQIRQVHQAGLRAGGGGRFIATWTRLVNAGIDFIIAPHPVRLKRWLG